MSTPAIGDRRTLRIEKAVAGGRMLARAEGAVVLVAGALPGELVEARVERSQRGTLWADTEAVLEPSPERVGLPDPCGGCVFKHAAYTHQLTLKQEIVRDAFARLGRIEIDAPPVVPSPTQGYRMRARLHVHGGRVGFYREGTHVLCEPAGTGQLLESTIGLIGEIQSGLTNTEGVTAIEIAENRDASERGIHLELAKDADSSRLGALAALPAITTLSTAHANSPRVRLLSGDGRVTDRFDVDGRAWTLSRTIQTFFQGNRYLLEPLVRHVVDKIRPGPAMDLYAGAGLFAIAAAAHGITPVFAVEGDALAAGDLRRNTADWRGVVQARHESVEAHLHDRRIVRPQTLVLDPPRTGLARRALDGIVALRAPRIVYVSCDVPTLARDTRGLVEAGYRLGELTSFDLFPNTAHVETVAVFDL